MCRSAQIICPWAKLSSQRAKILLNGGDQLPATLPTSGVWMHQKESWEHYHQRKQDAIDQKPTNLCFKNIIRGVCCDQNNLVTIDWSDQAIGSLQRWEVITINLLAVVSENEKIALLSKRDHITSRRPPLLPSPPPWSRGSPSCCPSPPGTWDRGTPRTWGGTCQSPGPWTSKD